MDRVEAASEEDLRAVLLALCKDGRIEKRVEGHFKKLEAAKKKTTKTGVKRKASGPFLLCVRCSESFSEESNHSKACTYHPGKSASERARDMQIDYDDPTWEYWDERCHGPMDTEENQGKLPDGFFWDCCEAEGTAPGCTKGHHYAIEGKRMKTTTDKDSVSDGAND